MFSVVDQVGARSLWEDGVTGEGVNVAVIDTGVADVAALSGGDKVVAMVDLSAEAGVPEARFADTYGHGTHMAGIIAGRTPGADPSEAEDHPEWFLGVAPDAGIVSVKVGDNSGAVDVTQVIAGVDWVVDHADELDIRVINLSYSSGSSLPYWTDPLTYSVERAWQAGIVVVVAAGNDGLGQLRLGVPANDPYMIAVGGVEAVAPSAFAIPSWATNGNGLRNPDVAAPGAHIESLRAPLSRVDLEHPEGFVDDVRFRGSGSSQAAAVVSGAVALMLDANPSLTPDQVKAALRSTADATVLPASGPSGVPRSYFAGKGVIRVDRAAELAPSSTTQTFKRSDGSGLIDAARGDISIVINGSPLDGELTVLGTVWDGTRWSGTRWSNGTWDGTRWSGGEWMGTRWSDATWTGAAWLGSSWTGTRWSGTRWSGSAWTATSWTGTRWSGTRWSDDSWTGALWDGTRWSGTRWSGTRWSSAGWS